MQPFPNDNEPVKIIITESLLVHKYEVGIYLFITVRKKLLATGNNARSFFLLNVQYL